MRPAGCPRDMSVGRFRNVRPEARTAEFPFLQDNLAGDAAVGAHDAAAWMRGGAAHIKVADRGAVVGPTGDGAEEEKLFERKLALKNVALSEAEFALEMERGEDLAPDDDVFDVGRDLGDGVDDVVADG